LAARTRNSTHAKSSPDSPEYETWKGMMKRCHSPRDVRFQRYGGRGIKVCVRWRRSFAAFLADMGRRPSRKHLIARIDDEGDYRPSNCRWATAKKQRANRRDQNVGSSTGLQPRHIAADIPDDDARVRRARSPCALR